MAFLGPSEMFAEAQWNKEHSFGREGGGGGGGGGGGEGGLRKDQT